MNDLLLSIKGRIKNVLDIHTTTPEKVILAGGMDLDREGWRCQPSQMRLISYLL